MVGWFFAFFFISGICSILYELIWLRLSMAQFGVNTALVSIVLSVFMGGLGFGSWASGELLRKQPPQRRTLALRLYAIIELLIGFSAIAVPYELILGRNLLEKIGYSSSTGYYLASGLWIAFTIFPWCSLMGATIPVVMEAIRQRFPQQEHRSFSFLYVANVAGAAVGTFIPLFLIEVFGFRGTLRMGALLNFSLFLLAFALSTRAGFIHEARMDSETVPLQAMNSGQKSSRGTLLLLLFLTGLTSMGLEVAWIRQFTPYVGTVVYAFATILLVYLGATFLGSRIYRYWSAGGGLDARIMWSLLPLAALVSPVAANPNFHISSIARVVLGIAPFTGVVGFLSPLLVDRWSGGEPAKAGGAYAINVLGCILGPLIAGFVLLPKTSERWSVFVLSLPWLFYGIYSGFRSGEARLVPNFGTRALAIAVLPLAVVLVLKSRDFEQRKGFPRSFVRRDHTATIIATGQGMSKQLLVNGVGITIMTPITKMMAHIPLSLLPNPPRDGLVICFGMGTTYRSMMSWGIPVTAVELVPSVPRMFWFYHADGPQIMRSALSHVVIDDGRRYLERTPQSYDVIVVDPPPPVEAAASSLLYSKEFYAIAKRRLRSNGILQQWIPAGDPVELSAVARALTESFPHVLAFRSIAGWGYHFLASQNSIQGLDANLMVQHMPKQAVTDLMEWGPKSTPESEFAAVLATSFPIQKLRALASDAPALSDDRPLNEYYVLRRDVVPRKWQHLVWEEHPDSNSAE